MAVVKNLMVRSGADFSALYQEMNKSQRKLSAWQKNIGKTLKGIGAILGGLAAGKIAKDFVTTAMRTEVLDVAMRSVAKSSGYAIQALQEHRKAVMEMGIAEQEATQILTRFMQAQLDTAYAAKLARVAQDAAVIANMNSSEAAEQMTEAIAKLRPELLSAFGFTRNLNDIYSDYAKTVGKTVKQLSETEKKQAMLNYILKEGEKIAGTYEASMGVVGKQISSLPRYYDTLKNAIAKPLALPAVGVAVEAITNTLKSAIAWAEANKETLQRWGQSIAGVVRTVVKGFSLITGAIVKNWQVLKFVGTTFLTYIALIKGAAIATTIFKTASAVMTGTIAANVPVLSALSIAINTYRLQVALAPVATNIFSAALYRLQAALYAVHAALGPIGWVILAISAAISGGMVLWNKYTQSLQKAVKTAAPADLVKGFRNLEKSTKKSADATEDQADALTEAGKAAGKNLQSFDEIHQLQKDMAGGGGAGEDILDEFDLGGIGGGLPGLDMGDMMADIEQIKPTLSGFWEWIKQGVRNLSDWLKEKTGLALWELIAIATGPLGTLAVFFARHWDEIKKTVSVVWSEIWKLIKTYWNNWAKLATDVFGAIWDYITGTWDNIKNATSAIWGAIWGFLKSQWETIRDFGSNIFGILADLITGRIDLRTAIKLIWGEIKSFLSGTWNNIKSLGINIWTAIREFIETQSELSKTLVISIWTAIKEFIIGNWEAIKESATNIWTAVSGLIKHIWEDINDVVTRIATSILNFLGLNWDDIKAAAKTAWEWVGKYIVDPIESAKQTVLNIIDTIKSAFANMKITIPKPKLPHITVTTKTKKIGDISIPIPDFDINWYAQGGIFDTPSVIGVGEAGAEAVLPLERNTGWMDTLAAKIAASIGGAGGGDIYVYVGNEQVDAYVYRSQDRRNIKSNGR